MNNNLQTVSTKKKLFASFQEIDIKPLKNRYGDGNAEETTLAFRVRYQLRSFPKRIEFKIPNGYQLWDLTAERPLLDTQGVWKTTKKQLEKERIELVCLVRDLAAYCSQENRLVATPLDIHYEISDNKFVCARITIKTQYKVDIRSEAAFLNICKMELEPSASAACTRVGIAPTELHGKIREKIAPLVENALKGRIADRLLNKKRIEEIVSDPNWLDSFKTDVNKALSASGLLLTGVLLSVSDPFGSEWDAYQAREGMVRQMEHEKKVIQTFDETRKAVQDLEENT